MTEDRAPTPAEQRALDRPWRMWASLAIGSFTLVSIVLGFIILPLTEGRGESLFVSICRAIGIPGFADTTDASAPALLGTGTVSSQLVWNVDTRSLIASADASRGEELALGTCAGCHGEAGIAPAAMFPNLAGQRVTAIFKQLHDYRSETRKGGQADMMTAMVQGLNDQQFADVAAFYSTRPVSPLVSPASVAPATIQLVQIGEPARALPSCNSCHAGNMTGPQEAPALEGQSAEYLLQQMQLFASGERANDLHGRMRDIARQLTPQEMEELARYYGGAQPTD